MHDVLHRAGGRPVTYGSPATLPSHLEPERKSCRSSRVFHRSEVSGSEMPSDGE
jgi:hypothetical protein